METTAFDRSDKTIENVLRMVRPFLEAKGVIGKVINVSELARICHDRKSRLPFRPYHTKEMHDELFNLTNKTGTFILDDLRVRVFAEINAAVNGFVPKVEFQRIITEEQNLEPNKPANQSPEPPMRNY